MSEISETEIKSMTKEQNYMRGYKDGKTDVLDKIRAEIESIERYGTNNGHDIWLRTPEEIKKEVLQIIDKYKKEGEK